MRWLSPITFFLIVKKSLKIFEVKKKTTPLQRNSIQMKSFHLFRLFIIT